MVVTIFYPIIFIAISFLSEDNSNSIIESGYIDDESGLNLTKINSVINFENIDQFSNDKIKSIIDSAKIKKQKISISGTRHSMGGHTFTEDGIILNMMFSKAMKYDEVNNEVTVAAGVTWFELLAYLNQFGMSVAVMQSFSDFSIGGSVSVNGHGWQNESGPISATVKSIDIINSNGELLTCSRQQNKELFSLAIGGYGVFGVIVNVTLEVVNNENLVLQTEYIESNKYLEKYNQILANNEISMIYGRLNITENSFLDKSYISYFRRLPSIGIVVSDLSIKSRELERIIFRSSVGSNYGKNLRWILEKINSNIE